MIPVVICKLIKYIHLFITNSTIVNGGFYFNFIFFYISVHHRNFFSKLQLLFVGKSRENI